MTIFKSFITNVPRAALRVTIQCDDQNMHLQAAFLMIKSQSHEGH